MTAAHPARKGTHRGDVMAKATQTPSKKTPARTKAAAKVANDTTKPFRMKGKAKNRARAVAPTMIYLIVLFIGVVSIKHANTDVSCNKHTTFSYYKVGEMGL
jgi:hypothetical protein